MPSLSGIAQIRDSVPLLSLEAARQLEVDLPGRRSAPVTRQNFAFALLDLSMGKEAALGADNGWRHQRKPLSIDEQTAPLANRDTLHSFAIVDASRGVVVMLPRCEGRYVSLQILQRDHVTDQVHYGEGSYRIEPETVTRFVAINVRTQINCGDAADVARANVLQDLYRLAFPSGYSPRSFEPIDWNREQLGKLIAEYQRVAAVRGVCSTMGRRGTILQEDINVGAAAATGLLPDKHAWYSFRTYEAGQHACLEANYPVPGISDPAGFYSVTIYGKDLYLHSERDSSLTSRELEMNPGGGSFLLHVGCPGVCGRSARNLLMAPGDTWTLALRVYLPDRRVQDDEYVLPDFKPLAM